MSYANILRLRRKCPSSLLRVEVAARRQRKHHVLTEAVEALRDRVRVRRCAPARVRAGIRHVRVLGEDGEEAYVALASAGTPRIEEARD